MKRYIPYMAILIFFLCSSQMYKAPLPAPVVPAVAIGETADTDNVRFLAKDGAYISPADTVTDAVSNGGAGGDVLRWSADLDIYTAPEAIFMVDMPNTGYYCVWISYKGGGTDYQLNTSDLKTYTNSSFGYLVSHTDAYSFALAENYNHTPKKFNITATGNKKFYFRTGKGVRVDGVYIGRTSDGTSTGSCNATPSLPSGVAPFTPDYTIESYNSITVNHILTEDEWANAPNLTFGTIPSGWNNTIDKFTLLWNDVANRVCGAVQVTDSGGSNPYTFAGWSDSDHIEVILSPGVLNQPSATETVKYAINADCSGTSQLEAWLWGTANFSTDWTSSAAMSASCLYAANQYTIEWCANLPWNPAPNDGINYQADIHDNDNTGSHWDAIAKGTLINTPSTWGTGQVVSAAPPSPPPDATAPDCGTPDTSTTNVAQTSFTASVGPCTDNQNTPIHTTFYWGTTASYGNSQEANAVVSGGTPSLSITGLDCNTTYHWKAVMTDDIGNPTDTGDKTQATSACSGLYISPSGTDTGNCDSSGAACKTFTYIKGKCNTTACQGKTIWLADGNYSAASGTGLPNIDCASGWANGTASANITIRATNERQAHFISTGTSPAFYIHNCHYWNIIGIYATNADLPAATATTGGEVIKLDHVDHIKLQKAIADHTNRYANNADAISLGYVTNSLIEDTEIYYFTRFGISDYHGVGNTFRRVYANSRNHGDLRVSKVGSTLYCNNYWNTTDPERGANNSGPVINLGTWKTTQCATLGQCCGVNPTGSTCTCHTCVSGDTCSYVSIYHSQGDAGIGSYASADYTAAHKLVENSVSEYNQSGMTFGLNPNDGTPSQLLGSIMMNNVQGVFLASSGATADYNNNIINDVIIGGSYGINDNGSTNVVGTNITILNATLYDLLTNNNSNQSPSQTSTWTNVLSYASSTQPAGIRIQAQDNSPNVLYSNSYGHTTNYYPTETISDTSGVIQNSLSVAPTAGIGLTGTNCIAYIPSSATNLKEAGQGGADIGANIIYEYVDGSPTSQKLWCQSGDTRPECSISGGVVKGQFPCGVLVTGLNDNATGATVGTAACRNVGYRLNLKDDLSGCPIP